jgi:glycoside/pentoside/hexuronide:cation symporter, GPH family
LVIIEQGLESKLPISKLIGYSIGMCGWSILNNLIATMLIYIYLPPINSGMNSLIPPIVYLGIFSILALIAAGGRLFDAITDPLIAWLSDRSKHNKGRRIPFMRVGWIPAFAGCIAVFMPVQFSESKLNIISLIISLTIFYLAITVYFIPYNALMPELAKTSREKVTLSTWMSLAYVLGLIIAAQTPLIAHWVEHLFDFERRIHSFQIAITFLSLIAGCFLLIPIISIDEKRFTGSQPAEVSFLSSLTRTLKNYNFRLFIFADFSYFMAISIIASGMLYYLKVLLGLEEAMGSTVFGVMILVSLLFYPLVLYITKHVRKKFLISFGLIFMGLIFLAVYFLGKLPMPPKTQIYLFALLASIPVAILGILPYAVIAEIAQLDGLTTGHQKEAMYFAVRNFFYKLGMTVGIMCFTILTLWGKDPGNDLGIRLNGIVGFIMCTVAGLTFLLFREKEIIHKIHRLSRKK